MYELYLNVLYKPVLNFLVFLHNVVPGHDIGLAIIILTILIKLILLPLTAKSIKSQKALQDIQPKVEALKAKYKDDKQKLAAETMALYKEQKVNPFSSCLPLLIQFPLLIAVYQAFNTGLTSTDLAPYIYPFVSLPEHLNTISLGFIDLSKTSLPLAILAGAAQYLQTAMLNTKKPAAKSEASKDEAMLSSVNKSMLYFMPFLTVIIGMSLPGGLTLYWFLMTALTALQQVFIFKKKKENTPAVEIIPPVK
jgi:YidC/Oxa1 family membrane protein insertase